MSLYDQQIANQATAVDQCMKLGAVILKPKTEPTIGFTQQARDEWREEFKRPHT